MIIYSQNIKQEVHDKLKNFIAQLTDKQYKIIKNQKVEESIQYLFAISHYAYEKCCMLPDLLCEQLKNHTIVKSYTVKELTKQLQKEIKADNNQQQIMQKIRYFRHKNMIRILWRESTNIASISEIVLDLSSLAEACVEVTLQHSYKTIQATFGTPLNAVGQKQLMTILALGKLGGRELNFSSDIDLIFFYQDNGRTDHPQNTIENQLFFAKVGQLLLSLLSQITSDGFAYRTDLRLRPYGQKGALVWSMNAIIKYCYQHGRNWERYAWIKARPIAGDLSAGHTLLASLEAFIYPHHIHFDAINLLTQIKKIIHKKSLFYQKNHIIDIKHNTGGIRAIEFIVQSFQILHGNRHHLLKQTGLLNALNIIDQLHFLSRHVIDTLKESYLFLRTMEHYMQIWQDQQISSLPSDPKACSILTLAMQYSSWPQLLEDLQKKQQKISKLFYSLKDISPRDKQEKDRWLIFLQSTSDQQNTLENKIQESAFLDKEVVLNKLTDLYRYYQSLKINQEERSQLDIFLSTFLSTCEQQPNPDQAFLLSLPVTLKIIDQPNYIQSLLEQPEMMVHFIHLCRNSQWIIGEVIKQPTLLNKFFNFENIYHPLSLKDMQSHLKLQLSNISIDDIHARLTALCHFKIAQHLNSVIAEMTGATSLLAISNHLTWIAECIIQEVVTIAWTMTVKKHGFPADYKIKKEMPFIVIGYGKLGGLEISPNSDLDLVFVHNSDIHQQTIGKNPIDNQAFFSRLGQKVIQFLSQVTPLGKLYNVDIRLRPSGNSGLLVSSFSAFEKYQKESAWTWECQALIKSRVIVSDNKELTQLFGKLRKEILILPRETKNLQQKVKSIRIKMLLLDQSSSEKFDIKYGRGGIVDLEFIVQYLVLKWANQYPNLITWTDNIRLLETLQKENILATTEADKLTKAYISLRKKKHQHGRWFKEALVDPAFLQKERHYILKMWNKWLDDNINVLDQ